jgi:hypothetical protein
MAAGFLVDVAGARDLLTIGEALVSDKYGADTCAPGGRRSRWQCMRERRSRRARNGGWAKAVSVSAAMHRCVRSAPLRSHRTAQRRRGGAAAAARPTLRV